MYVYRHFNQSLRNQIWHIQKLLSKRKKKKTSNNFEEYREIKYFLFLFLLSVFITNFFFSIFKNNPSDLAHEDVILWLKPLFLLLSFKFLFFSHALAVYLLLFWFYLIIISFQWSGEEEKKIENCKLSLRFTLLTRMLTDSNSRVFKFGELPISPKKTFKFVSYFF